MVMKGIGENLEPIGVSPGRPSFICATICDSITEHIGNGVPIHIACAAVGINKTTYHRWRAKGEALLKAQHEQQERGQPVVQLEGNDYLYVKLHLDIEAARANALAERIAQVTTAGSEDWRAAGWYLERQIPEEFGQKSRTELTGVNGGPIEVAQAEIVSEAQRIVTEQMKQLERGQDGK